MMMPPGHDFAEERTKHSTVTDTAIIHNLVNHIMVIIFDTATAFGVDVSTSIS